MVMFANAVLIYLAQASEYRGLDYMNQAESLALAGALGTVLLVVLAVWNFRKSTASDSAPIIFFMAALPFIVGWLLENRGTQSNVHGAAIIGFLFYTLGSEVCALALLIALLVRRSRSAD